MKAVLHFNAGAALRRRLAQIAFPEIVVVDEADGHALRTELADAEVLLHVLMPVTAEMIAGAPRIRLIQKIGVGVNTIDRAAAARAGVAVANMPGTNTQAVAEHTLALMLATLRKIAVLDAATRRGEGWRLPADERPALREVAGSTVGLVGYGAVPQRLAPVLAALGAEVQFWNRSPRTAGCARQVALDQLLETSDIVPLHLPFVRETFRLIDAAALARCKRGAVLINTARGELVDGAALAAVLRAGALAGAGLDVFEDEPAIDTRGFGPLPNVVMSPHIAWHTPETFERSIAVIVENCRRLATGEALLNRVLD